MLRFLYLNIYSFLLVFAGAAVLLVPFLLPFYQFKIIIFIIQIIIVIYLLHTACMLFSVWDDKKKKIEILIARNREEFRPDTFEVFMQAPCGRLVAKAVLCDLNKKDEYKNLLKLKKPFFTAIKENCMPQKTVVYINENFVRGENC